MNSMEEKNWETKFEYANEIVDLLINSMEDLDIGEIMFQKIVITDVRYNNKPPYNKIINNTFTKYNKTRFIDVLQSQVLDFVEPNSELFEFISKKGKEIITNEEIEIFLDYLVEQGFLKKEEYETTEYFGNREIKTTNYRITLKLFLSRSDSFIFYAMEFPVSGYEDQDIRYQFYKKLKQSIEVNLKLKVIMLYDDKQSGNLNKRIKNEIRTCSFFIADLTSENNFNPNVMYEIGMAEGFNKKILQIINEEKWDQIVKDKKLPFDISSHNTIKYSMNETKWEQDINEIIKSISASLRK